LKSNTATLTTIPPKVFNFLASEGLQSLLDNGISIKTPGMGSPSDANGIAHLISGIVVPGLCLLIQLVLGLRWVDTPNFSFMCHHCHLGVS
jgi:hypothetical protein